MSTPTPAPALTDEQIEAPSINEIRADYVWAHTRNFDAYTVGKSLTSEQEVYGERFDRTVAAVVARAKREERERIGAQTIYVVQEWVDADGIHDGWNTAYGSFTNSRADAEGTLEYLRKTHRATEFRLVAATRSDWTEATDGTAQSWAAVCGTPDLGGHR